jgi:hypothetical protein
MKAYDIDKVIDLIRKERSQNKAWGDTKHNDWGYWWKLVGDINQIFKDSQFDPDEIDKEFEHWGKCYLWAADLLRWRKAELIVEVED